MSIPRVLLLPVPSNFLHSLMRRKGRKRRKRRKETLWRLMKRKTTIMSDPGHLPLPKLQGTTVLVSREWILSLRMFSVGVDQLHDPNRAHCVRLWLPARPDEQEVVPPTRKPDRRHWL